MPASACSMVLSSACRLRLLTQLHTAWRPTARSSRSIATTWKTQHRHLSASTVLRQQNRHHGRSHADGSRADDEAVQGVPPAGNKSGSFQEVEPSSDAIDHSTGENAAEEVASPSLTSDTEVTQARSVNDAVRAARQEYGDRLPDGVLSAEEYKIYERLYGPPMSEAQEQATSLEEDIPLPEKDALFREMQDGSLEGVDYQEDHDFDDVVLGDQQQSLEDALDEEDQAPVSRKQQRRTRRDDERLAQDIEAAVAANKGIKREESDGMLAQLMEDMRMDFDDEAEGQYNDGETTRTHPFTLANRFGTTPATLHIPQDIVQPVASLLSKLPNKHIDEAAARAFGGPALPYATGSPQSSKIMPQKPIPLGPGQNRMTEMEADVYIAAVMPGAYAATTSVLVEVRRRMGSAWIEKLLQKEGGPRVLDVGASGAGVIAWREILKAEWNRMHNIEPSTQAEADLEEKSEPDEHDQAQQPQPPLGKATVLASSPQLQHRASVLLENTTFLPRLPDYVHAHFEPDAQRKQYDVIIAPYSLWHLQENYERRQRVLNLWSLLDPNGGVLILLEKGVPRGFEVIADARAYLLGELFEGGKEASREEISSTTTFPSQPDSSSPSTSSTTADFPNPSTTLRGSRRAPGRILAPCTNHTKCPMYLVPGVSRQRKDWCHFSQRYVRPPYLQRILNGKDRNHDDVHFSYVAVQKGVSFDKDEEGRVLRRGDEATERAFDGYDVGDGDLAAGTATTASPPSSSPSPSPTTPSPHPHPHPTTLPLLIYPPLKKPGHILLDMCTPSGTLERWSVPRSYGRQAYRDARKSKWGDLWALGARQRTAKRVRLGREHMERGFGVGRGVEAARRVGEGRERTGGLRGEVVDVEGEEKREGKGKGSGREVRQGRGGGKDVKGRGRPRREGEGEGPDEVEAAMNMSGDGQSGSGKAKRAARQRELKMQARDKARLRRKGRELKEELES